ncbi:MAG: N-acetyltransferase [Pirellulaceae bacterium]|nr:N-acetyltransferase [Pirellulaceae bacterium]
MPNYEVVTVGKNRRLQKQFIQLAWDLYRDDPNWVPPLLQTLKEGVGFSRNPFYDQNRCECFLALRDGLPVGRVCALVNEGHNLRFEERRGFFGFFECYDDPLAAKGLMDAAAKYLVAQGMLDMRGPANPSLNQEVGLLVEGFDTPPTFMMTYNRPYYERLLTGVGFEKCQDLYSFDGHIDMIADLDPKLSFVITEIKRRFNVNVRRMNLKRFTEEVSLFLDIYNRSLIGTWGFVPLSAAEVAHQAKGLKHLIVPELTTIIEVDGRPIGAGLGLMDFNPLIKQINGRLFPFGFLKLMTGKRKLKRVRLMSTNVLPEFQRWGFGLLALERMLPDARALGVETGEFSWVLESNHLSRGSLERSGLTRAKTYRVYDRSLSDYR